MSYQMVKNDLSKTFLKVFFLSFLFIFSLLLFFFKEKIEIVKKQYMQNAPTAR